MKNSGSLRLEMPICVLHETHNWIELMTSIYAPSSSSAHLQNEIWWRWAEMMICRCADMVVNSATAAVEK